jgi:hypothetical protein
MLARTNGVGLKLTNYQLAIPQKLHLPLDSFRRCFRLRNVGIATDTALTSRGANRAGAGHLTQAQTLSGTAGIRVYVCIAPTARTQH